MASLAQLVAAQKANPATFANLSAAELTAIKPELLPVNGFSEDQRYWFARWWFVVTAPQVTAVNNALPANTRINPLSNNGNLYVCSDLLTDLDLTYKQIKAVIQALTPVYLDIDAVIAARPVTGP